MNINEEKFNYVGVDVETNGLDPKVDEILEIVAIEFNLSGETGEIFHQMCRPMSDFIPPKVSDINNITIDMVKDKPNYLKDGIQKEVIKFFGKRTIVGHNVINFDLNFIKILPKNVEDTLKMCKQKYPGRHNLKASCKKVGIKWNDEEAHRAEYDTRKTIELFCKMKQAEMKKESNQATLPMFENFEEVPKNIVDKLGITPSEKDKDMMATQAYSFSRINLFYQCPFKWYMQYIKGIKEPEKDYFDTGKICHSVAEWSGDWCYKVLFANKFQSYFNKKKLNIGPKTKEGLAKYFNKKIDYISSHDFGLYLYENSEKINKYFPDIKGRADFISAIDHVISVDSYEKPSMPPIEVYDEMIRSAINEHRCNNPDVINDVKKIMHRFYELKDFSIMPGDITITEKRLAFDKDWNVLSNFFSNKTFFRGIIDVIDYFGDYVIITDYKTSRTMLNEEQLKEDRQMKTYLLLIYNFLPKGSYKKIILRIEYIRFGKSIEYEISDVDAAAKEALKWVNDSIQKIEKEMLKTDGTAFQPIRNEYCHTCHIGEDAKCPLFNKNMINNIDDPFSFVVADVEDCQTAWKRIEANKSENSRLTKLCKAFVKTCSNPIKIDEKATLDFYVGKEIKCNTEETIKLMLEKGIDIKYLIKFFNINLSSLISLCESKNIKLSEDEKERICIIKQKTTFDAFTEEEIKKKNFLNS